MRCTLSFTVSEIFCPYPPLMMLIAKSTPSLTQPSFSTPKYVNTAWARNRDEGCTAQKDGEAGRQSPG